MASAKSTVVLGADVEGLVAAALLADAGRSVVVVDAGVAGGIGAPWELAPGHVVPGLLHDSGVARRAFLDRLSLDGLAWHASEPEVLVCGDDGDALTLTRAAAGRGADAEAYVRWRAFVDRIAPLVVDVLDDAPPEADEPGALELFRLARKGLRLRSLGDADMMELLRIVTMPVWDWTDEWFEDELLRAGLSALVAPGTVFGPRAAGTTALLLMREAARGVEPVGGTAAVVAALVARCESRGVRFRLGRRPSRIELDATSARRTVTGVVLEDGERIDANEVLSTLDPSETLVDLVAAGLLPEHVEREARTWRVRGSTAILALALSERPTFAGARAERVLTAGSRGRIERAADALKYGAAPADPWLDVRVWSEADGGAAPAGKATLSVHVHGVSHQLDGGDVSALRSAALAELERVSPGVTQTIEHAELLTPSDLEARYGLRGGHLFRGELVLDQLWVQRPSLALCRYATPAQGLFLGGAASHPGGPFLGAAGALGARALLRG